MQQKHWKITYSKVIFIQNGMPRQLRGARINLSTVIEPPENALNSPYVNASDVANVLRGEASPMEHMDNSPAKIRGEGLSAGHMGKSDERGRGTRSCMNLRRCEQCPSAAELSNRTKTSYRGFEGSHRVVRARNMY